MKRGAGEEEMAMTQVMPKRIKRPLGRILVDAGLVTEEKLNAALEEQQSTNKFVGEILVAMGELDPRELDIVLSIQRELADPEQAVKIAAGVRKMLGEILFLAERITADQLERALKEQKQTREKTGEILVRLGIVTQREVDRALAIQAVMESGPKLPTRLRLGELLVAAKYLTREQLDDALGRQINTGQKLGQVLVESGFVEAKVITRVVRLQEMLMRAVLIAALSFATISAVTVPSAMAGTSATLRISAVVLARANLNILKQPRELVVTDADVRRGFVQVQDASMIQLKNNSRAGCLLSFASQGLPFQETTVSVMGRDVVLGQDGGLVELPVTGNVMVSLGYRFVLAQGTQPGTYAWPFSLSVSPLQ